MDYNRFLKECEEKTPTQIKSIALDSINKLRKMIDVLGITLDITKLLYYAALTVSFADNVIDDKEVKFLNSINEEFGLGENQLTVASAKTLVSSSYSQCLDVVHQLFGMLKKITDNDEFYKQYSSYTNKLKADELFIRYVCAIISINGDVDESEIDFIESLLGEVNDSTSSDDYGSSYEEPVEDEVVNNVPPKVVKVGGSLYKDKYNNTIFSVGAEILIEGQDVAGLDVRVQLLDSTGFILESHDDKINYVERGKAYFGKEFSINCQPSNFKVIVGARDRGDLEDDYRPNLVFKCSGMRFMRRTGSYDNNRWDLAAMVENVRHDSGNPETEVFTVFYDENDNIIGGARLDGEVLYLNQPDRYHTEIECLSVINRTRTFRWSFNLYFVR